MPDRSGDWFAQAERDLEAARAPVTDELRDAGRILDRYYIPARYPNGYAEGKPGDYIVTEDATDATAGAETIIRFSHGLLA